MGLAAVAAHKLGGVIPVGSIFRASIKVGRLRSKRSREEAPAAPAFEILP
jgi:hypothetical protein